MAFSPFFALKSDVVGEGVWLWVLLSLCFTLVFTLQKCCSRANVKLTLIIAVLTLAIHFTPLLQITWLHPSKMRTQSVAGARQSGQTSGHVSRQVAQTHRCMHGL